jgi:hypothetical protein
VHSIAEQTATSNYSVFWVITRHKTVSNRRFGTTYWSHIQGSSFKEHDPWRWDWQTVTKRRFHTTLRRVITQKTEQFSSTAAEAYDHKWPPSFYLPWLTFLRLFTPAIWSSCSQTTDNSGRPHTHNHNSSKFMQLPAAAATRDSLLWSNTRQERLGRGRLICRKSCVGNLNITTWLTVRIVSSFCP